MNNIILIIVLSVIIIGLLIYIYFLRTSQQKIEDAVQKRMGIIVEQKNIMTNQHNELISQNQKFQEMLNICLKHSEATNRHNEGLINLMEKINSENQELRKELNERKQSK